MFHGSDRDGGGTLHVGHFVHARISSSSDHREELLWGGQGLTASPLPQCGGIGRVQHTATRIQMPLIGNLPTALPIRIIGAGIVRIQDRPGLQNQSGASTLSILPRSPHLLVMKLVDQGPDWWLEGTPLFFSDPWFCAEPTPDGTETTKRPRYSLSHPGALPRVSTPCSRLQMPRSLPALPCVD